MNIRVSAWCLSATLALIASTITPAMADEWNKETHLEFNAPVAIPGKVLPPGKYIFRLADSPSDRQIIQVFSEDAKGNQKILATFFAVSKYSLKTPEKPVISLDERRSGDPEAISSWFYPGDNTGWEFIYPKSERLEVSSNVGTEQPAPTPAVMPTPPAPPLETPPTVTFSEVQVEKQAFIAQNEPPIFIPAPAEDTQSSVAIALPQTAGYSAAELMAGVTMLGLGLLILFVWFRRSAA
jgi:hypothetical protein